MNFSLSLFSALKKTFAVMVLMTMLAAVGLSQDAGYAYILIISSEYKKVAKAQWEYSTSVIRMHNVRNAESRRADLLTKIDHAETNLNDLDGFEGNTTLRDAALTYLAETRRIVRNDYDLILDMEPLAKQSAENLRLYLNSHQEANEKLQSALEKLENQQTEFANQYKVDLAQTNSNLGGRMMNANEVFRYYNQIYLIFFRSYLKETAMVNALNSKNFDEAAINMDALVLSSHQGMTQLRTYASYSGDPSLANACNGLLSFYLKEAEKDVQVLMDFPTTLESFNQWKSNFDAMDPGARTEADINEYNERVGAINQSIAQFNAVNERVAQERTTLIDAWNLQTRDFVKQHIR